MTQDIILKQGSEIIDLGNLGMAKTGLVVTGEFTFDDWQRCGAILQRLEGSVQWCVGDWLVLGQKWGDKYQKAIEETGLDYGTLANYKSTAERVNFNGRHENLSYEHHRVIAKFEPADQKRWLNLAEKKNLSVRELKQAIADEKRGHEIETIKLLSSDVYSIIYADPPWQYDFSVSDSRKIENQYPTMPIEKICSALDDIGMKVANNAILFLWATSPKLTEAMQVVEAWGFTYKTCAVWVKDKIGMGYYFRQRHELLLVATKGEPPTPPASERPDSVMEYPRGEHSAKPTEVQDLIDGMYPDFSKVELFARNNDRKGWTSWGNQA